VGTRGGEHLVLCAGPILKPDDVGQVPQGTTGSPPLRPVRVDATTIVHVERGFRRLYELTLNEESTRISRVRDLTLLAEHILSGGVTQLAYQRQPIKTLWAVRSDGQLVGLTMELLEEVRGWHRHTTAGAFESVAILPVDDAQDTDETEQLWCVVRREIAGATRRFIEVARPGVTTQAERLAALTVDCALAYAGAPATTFSGLDHLEGAAVRLVQREAAAAVTLAGETVMVHRLTDLGSQVVSGGEVETPYAVEMLDVGLHFDAHITTLRPEIPADDGTLQMRKRRWAAMHARLIDSVGLTVGGVMVPMRDVAHLMDTGLEPEDVDVKAAIGEWTTDGRVTFAQTLPFPSTILLVSGELEYEEAE
jgi:hypothetical protein